MAAQKLLDTCTVDSNMKPGKQDHATLAPSTGSSSQLSTMQPKPITQLVRSILALNPALVLSELIAAAASLTAWEAAARAELILAAATSSASVAASATSPRSFPFAYSIDDRHTFICFVADIN